MPLKPAAPAASLIFKIISVVALLSAITSKIEPGSRLDWVVNHSFSLDDGMTPASPEICPFASILINTGVAIGLSRAPELLCSLRSVPPTRSPGDNTKCELKSVKKSAMRPPFTKNRKSKFRGGGRNFESRSSGRVITTSGRSWPAAASAPRRDLDLPQVLA